MATLHLHILTKCLFCTFLTFKYIHFAQHTMTSCAPSYRQKDWSRLVQDWSLSQPKKSRTRTDASPTGVGPGPQSSPKLVQSSLVLSLSSVLGPDFQTLVVMSQQLLTTMATMTQPVHDDQPKLTTMTPYHQYQQ